MLKGLACDADFASRLVNSNEPRLQKLQYFLYSGLEALTRPCERHLRVPRHLNEGARTFASAMLGNARP